jgi:hypothetical protein
MSRHPSVPRSTAVLALVAACCGPLAASAALQAGPVIKLATTGSEPAVDSSGQRVAVAWRDGALYARSFDGASAATASLEVAPADWLPAQPAIAVDAAGRLVVAWRGGDTAATGVIPGGDGDGSGIFLRRFRAHGTSLGERVQVNDDIVGSQTHPLLDQAADGRIALAWEEPNATVVEVRARAFDAHAKPVGRALTLAARGVGASELAGIGVSTGYVTVGWTDQLDCADGQREASGALARVSWAGNPLGGVYRAGDGDCDGRGPRLLAALGSDLEGALGVFVNRKYTAVRFDAQTAAPELPRFDVAALPDCDDDFCSRIVAVAGDRRGRVAVIWEDVTGSPSSPETQCFWLWAQIFGKDGLPKTDRFAVSEPPSIGADEQPAVALGASGQLVVAWRRGAASEEPGVFVRSFRL